MDDLVSQVHMLETSKMKLELEITQMKKDFRREIQTKEDDLEDIRLANSKKVKVLEAQLEQEHEERMGQVRDKHELEAKVQSLQDLLDRSGDEEVLTKLRRDLKRTKALLKDAQMYMEKNQSDGTNKVIVRQLKNQVFIIVNIPSGQSSAKLPAILSLSHLVTSNSVTRSLGHLVPWSFIFNAFTD